MDLINVLLLFLGLAIGMTLSRLKKRLFLLSLRSHQISSCAKRRRSVRMGKN